MADNIELNAGTGGAIVATDEVTGSVHYQLIKPAFGGLGVATLVTGSTPLPIQGTTDFPIPIFGSVSIIGTSPVSGSVSIIGGTVGANITGGALTGTSPISGSVSIIGTVATTATITMGTVPALLGTSAVSGSVSIIGGTVGVNVTGGALTGTSPVSGSVSIIGGTVGANITGGSVNVSNQGGSVQVSGGSIAVGGTVTITTGSMNISNQGGSVQVSSIVGTLPDRNQNQIYGVVAGTTSSILGSVGGTGDYLSHLTIVVASTDANQVILADHTSGTFTVFVSVPGPGKGTYTVAVDAYSRFGPWRLTTGGGVTVLASGRFTN